MKDKLNNKGFTLIELLAVIVILAILMALAVTSMQKIMDDAKKNTYVTTAQQFVNAVRIGVVNMDYATPEGDGCVIVPVSLIDLEQGNQKSPFGKNLKDDNSFILIKNSNASGSNQLSYYVTMADASNNGFKLTIDSVLSKDNVIMRGADGFTGIARPSGNVPQSNINGATSDLICTTVKVCTSAGC